MSDGDPIRDAAAWEVLESAADKVMQRSRRFTLAEVCDRLNVDPDRVRRAAQLREEDGDV